MEILIVLVIAISLSMDAFSLSIAYGTLNFDKKDILKLSTIVGLFHFIMPILGMLIGAKLFHILPIKPNLIAFVILFFIGIQMILESLKKIQCLELINIKQLLVFGFVVSVDSFSVGIGLKAISENYYGCSLLFAISSFIFTYLGLMLGRKINNLIGKTATILGGVILILIGIIYLLH